MIVSSSADSAMNQSSHLQVSAFSDADFSEDEDTDDIPIGNVICLRSIMFHKNPIMLQCFGENSS